MFRALRSGRRGALRVETASRRGDELLRGDGRDSTRRTPEVEPVPRAPARMITQASSGRDTRWRDSKAPGYRRNPDLPESCAFIFDGVDEEVIGTFGLIMDGSSGDEIDRFDVGRAAQRRRSCSRRPPATATSTLPGKMSWLQRRPRRHAEPRGPIRRDLAREAGWGSGLQRRVDLHPRIALARRISQQHLNGGRERARRDPVAAGAFFSAGPSIGNSGSAPPPGGRTVDRAAPIRRSSPARRRSPHPRPRGRSPSRG